MKIPTICSKEISATSWCRRVLCCLIAILILAALLVFIIEPCTRYRRPKFYKEFFTDDDVQIPGILRHYDYNGIMMGSSMSQNFTLRDFYDEFGVSGIKATMSGSIAGDYEDFLKCAAETHSHTTKYLILGLDIWCCTAGETSRRSSSLDVF